MVQHHIGNHEIEFPVFERNILDINHPVFDSLIIPERFLRLLQHAFGKIRKDQPGAAADGFLLSGPHIPRSASQLQHGHPIPDIVMRGNPVSEALLVGGIPAVDRNPDIQLFRRFILGFDRFPVIDTGSRPGFLQVICGIEFHYILRSIKK